MHGLLHPVVGWTPERALRLLHQLAAPQVTLFTLFQFLDLPHNSFLAGLHLHVSSGLTHMQMATPPGQQGQRVLAWVSFLLHVGSRLLRRQAGLGPCVCVQQRAGAGRRCQALRSLLSGHRHAEQGVRWSVRMAWHWPARVRVRHMPSTSRGFTCLRWHQGRSPLCGTLYMRPGEISPVCCTCDQAVAFALPLLLMYRAPPGLPIPSSGGHAALP